MGTGRVQNFEPPYGGEMNTGGFPVFRVSLPVIPDLFRNPKDSKRRARG
jgi:hypothetical protein